MTKIDRKLAVEVAKDALKQIKLNRFTACQGVYIDVSLNSIFIEEGDLDPEHLNSFQKLFADRKDITCEVCGIGSLFLSYINKKNKCSFVDATSTPFVKMTQVLPKILSGEELLLIEDAFERYTIGGFFENEVRRNLHSEKDINNLEELRLAACYYGNDQPTDKENLIIIMKNIIRNKGYFKIPKKYILRARREYAAHGNSWSPLN